MPDNTKILQREVLVADSILYLSNLLEIHLLLVYKFLYLRK
jgi:hypothetical protein